jgi:hypothetical protein
LEREFEASRTANLALARRVAEFEGFVEAVGARNASRVSADEIAVTRIAAAQTRKTSQWTPVAMNVRGRQVMALVDGDGPADPGDILLTIRRLTAPLRLVG